MSIIFMFKNVVILSFFMFLTNVNLFNEQFQHHFVISFFAIIHLRREKHVVSLR